MKHILLIILAISMVACSHPGYYGEYYQPRPIVQEQPRLPYDGPSKVTYIEHGVVPRSVVSAWSSTPTYYSAPRVSYHQPWIAPHYEYSRPVNYCAPAVWHRPVFIDRGCSTNSKTKDIPWSAGSDYGYSSYRNATRQ